MNHLQIVNNSVQDLFRCLTETIRLIRDGERWWGKREIIYLSLHCHHQNDSCLAMRALLMFRDCGGQSHKTVSTNHNLFEEKELKRIRSEVSLLDELMLNVLRCQLIY